MNDLSRVSDHAYFGGQIRRSEAIKDRQGKYGLAMIYLARTFNWMTMQVMCGWTWDEAEMSVANLPVHTFVRQYSQDVIINIRHYYDT